MERCPNPARPNLRRTSEPYREKANVWLILCFLHTVFDITAQEALITKNETDLGFFRLNDS